MNIIFHVKITFVKKIILSWKCLKKKKIFDHIFEGREKEKLGEKDSSERDR